MKPQVRALVPHDVDARALLCRAHGRRARAGTTLGVDRLHVPRARGMATALVACGSSSGWRLGCGGRLCSFRLIPERRALIAVLLEERVPRVELTVVVVALLLHARSRRDGPRKAATVPVRAVLVKGGRVPRSPLRCMHTPTNTTRSRNFRVNFVCQPAGPTEWSQSSSQ